MMTYHEATDITVPYEEELNGYTIYIEENPDRWTGGYLWSVCHGDSMLDSGLTFAPEDAFTIAKYNVPPRISYRN